MAALTTSISPLFASLSWMAVDYYRRGKVSSISWCSGALAGLVCITPACGFVAPWAAIIIGTLAGIVSNIACSMKFRLGYDDTFDVFGIHGVPGFLGMILTGIFSTTTTASMDGPTVLGGVVDGRPIQLAYNLIASVSIAAWAFVVTYGLALVFSKIPSLSLRSSLEDEVMGLDASEHGERGYEFVSASDIGLKGGEEVHRSKLSLYDGGGSRPRSKDNKAQPVVTNMEDI